MAQDQSEEVQPGPVNEVSVAEPIAPLSRSTGSIDLGLLPNLTGYMLRLGQLSIYQAFQRITAAEKIRPPQFFVLEVVGANPGIRPSDVSTAIGVSRANLVPLLIELETRGMISRKSDKADGRAHTLHLTPAGATERERLHNIVLPIEGHLAERIGADQRETLLRLLHALVDIAPKI